MDDMHTRDVSGVDTPAFIERFLTGHNQVNEALDETARLFRGINLHYHSV